MTTQTRIKKKSFAEILKERPQSLLELEMSLEEFSAHAKVSFDDRWSFFHWRVQGDDELYQWIYDHRSSRDNPFLSDAEIIEFAFKRLKYIQARKGQMNISSVYVQDCEEVNLFPRKGLEHAIVNVVKDRVDGLFRHSTSYWCGNGGGTSAPSIRSEVSDTRTDAILKGARELLTNLNQRYEIREKPEQYSSYLNKLRNFITSIEDEIRQPSLFG